MIGYLSTTSFTQNWWMSGCVTITDVGSPLVKEFIYQESCPWDRHWRCSSNTGEIWFQFSHDSFSPGERGSRQHDPCPNMDLSQAIGKNLCPDNIHLEGQPPSDLGWLHATYLKSYFNYTENFEIIQGWLQTNEKLIQWNRGSSRMQCSSALSWKSQKFVSVSWSEA